MTHSELSEVDIFELCDYMKEGLAEIITQREMECIQSNLQ